MSNIKDIEKELTEAEELYQTKIAYLRRCLCQISCPELLDKTEVKSRLTPNWKTLKSSEQRILLATLKQFPKAHGLIDLDEDASITWGGKHRLRWHINTSEVAWPGLNVRVYWKEKEGETLQSKSFFIITSLLEHAEKYGIESREIEEWEKEVAALYDVEDGWNLEENAPKPDLKSIEDVHMFAYKASLEGCIDIEVSPDALGGSAGWLMCGDREVAFHYFNRQTNPFEYEPLPCFVFSENDKVTSSQLMSKISYEDVIKWLHKELDDNIILCQK